MLHQRPDAVGAPVQAKAGRVVEHAARGYAGRCPISHKMGAGDRETLQLTSGCSQTLLASGSAVRGRREVPPDPLGARRKYLLAWTDIILEDIGADMRSGTSSWLSSGSS